MNGYLLLDPRFIHLRSMMPKVEHRTYESWLWRSTKRTLSSLLEALANAKRRNEARWALWSLDDAILRDIGIERSQIEGLVESMLRGESRLDEPERATVYRFGETKGETRFTRLLERAA